MDVNETTLPNRFLSHMLEERLLGGTTAPTTVGGTHSSDNSTATIELDVNLEKLSYIIILICGFAFFTLVVMYWNTTARRETHSSENYQQYIAGAQKKDNHMLMNHRKGSASVTIVNQAVKEGDHDMQL